MSHKKKQRDVWINKAKKFIIALNQYDASIYKWCYAKKLEYVHDPRDDDPKYN